MDPVVWKSAVANKLLAVLCVWTWVAAGGASAQQPVSVPPVTIEGRVVDEYTRRPITGVRVAFAQLDLTLLTDADGRFQLRQVPVGVYDLRLSAPGYRDATGNFAVMREGSFITTLTPLGSSAAPRMGRVVGIVTSADGERPLTGVRVRAPDLALDGLTGDDGRFSFASVPPGRHVVEFSSLGYALRQDTIAVVAGSTSDARVAMALDPVEIEPITVVVERRDVSLEAQGFYERRRVTAGDFIDRDRIEAQQPMVLTDLFSRVNGAELRIADPGNLLSRAVILRGGRRDGIPCYPSVYMDGLRTHVAGPSPVMINELANPDQVAGIEVYQGGSSIPVQYGGANAACGVIVIWTRR